MQASIKSTAPRIRTHGKSTDASTAPASNPLTDEVIFITKDTHAERRATRSRRTAAAPAASPEPLHDRHRQRTQDTDTAMDMDMDVDQPVPITPAGPAAAHGDACTGTPGMAMDISPTPAPHGDNGGPGIPAAASAALAVNRKGTHLEKQQQQQQQQQPEEFVATVIPVTPASSLCSDQLRAVDFLRSRIMHLAGLAVPQRVHGSTGQQRQQHSDSSALDMPLRPSLAAAHDQLIDIMDRVVKEEGCTASVLLLGERGSGKTLLVERALQTLLAKHSTTPGTGTASNSQPGSSSSSTAAAAAAASKPDKCVGVVRLSGLLHLDERSAFQEIARQLCMEFQQLFAKSATYDENLTFLRTMLQALHRCLKSVVFVIDELDAFTRKGKQVLLYNLLDTLAHSKVQACVVGISSMHDVMDHMEKRVKSRFLHRRILLSSPQEFEPRPARQAVAGSHLGGAAAAAAAVPVEETPLGILRSMLLLPKEAAAGAAAAAAAAGTSAKVTAGAGRARHGHAGGGAAVQGQSQGFAPGFVEQHNKAVLAALADPAVKAALLQLFNVRLRPSDLANICQCALVEWLMAVQQQQAPGQAAAAGAGTMLSAGHILRAINQHVGVHVSQTDTLAGLSVLQMFLVVAMYRLLTKNHEVCNFEMAYDEYRAMQGGLNNEQYKWSRPAALRAFQGLAVAGIVVYVGAGCERLASRGAAFAAVELRAGRQVIDGALRARGGACPDLLIRFFRMEV